MLSGLMQSAFRCTYPIVFHLTRFLDLPQMAPLSPKSRVAFSPIRGKVAKCPQICLTFKFGPLTMRYRLRAEMYMLIRSGREERGKKLLAFMARVICFNLESSFYGNWYC
jgi:hypothetical protein